MEKMKCILLMFLVSIGFTLFADDTLHCIANYELTPPMQEGSFMDIKNLGDINRDGFGDWAFVFHDENPFYPRDSVQIFFGSDTIDFTCDYTIQAHRIGNIGDINGDGREDIGYLKLYIENRYHVKDPQVFILYGGEDFDFVPDDSVTLVGGTAYQAQYSDLKRMYDFNGDDVSDLCVGLTFNTGAYITKRSAVSTLLPAEKIYMFLGNDSGTLSDTADAIFQPPGADSLGSYYWGNYYSVWNLNQDQYFDLIVTFCDAESYISGPENRKYITYVYYGNPDPDSMKQSVDTLFYGKIEAMICENYWDQVLKFIINERDSSGADLGYYYGGINYPQGNYQKVDHINSSPGLLDGNQIDDWCIYNDDFEGTYGEGFLSDNWEHFYLPSDMKPQTNRVEMNYLGNICGDGYHKLLIAEALPSDAGSYNFGGYNIYCYSFNKVLTGTTSLKPITFTLHQNYPNPLNPTTTISYELPESQNITLQIFDITGRLVETLYIGYKEAGHWEQTWNADNHSSGVYIYSLQIGDRSISKKMVVLK